MQVEALHNYKLILNLWNDIKKNLNTELNNKRVLVKRLTVIFPLKTISIMRGCVYVDKFQYRRLALDRGFLPKLYRKGKVGFAETCQFRRRQCRS